MRSRNPGRQRSGVFGTLQIPSSALTVKDIFNRQIWSRDANFTVAKFKHPLPQPVSCLLFELNLDFDEVSIFRDTTKELPLRQQY